MSFYEVSKDFDEAFSKDWLADVDMGDIGEVRRLLGGYGASLSDQEIAHIRHLLRTWADSAYYWWLDGRRADLVPEAEQVDNTGDGSHHPRQFP